VTIDSAGTRLPSHTPRTCRRFSLEGHARRGRGKAEAVAISHGSRGSNLQGRRAVQEKYA